MDTSLSTTKKRYSKRQKFPTLDAQIRYLINEDVNLCYQCEKCTSGCPVSAEMELVPAQIMHAAQLNLKQKILFYLPSEKVYSLKNHNAKRIMLSVITDTKKSMKSFFKNNIKRDSKILTEFLLTLVNMN
jgi:ferredoxin